MTAKKYAGVYANYHKIHSSSVTFQQINKAREDIGLDVIRVGNRDCLLCEGEFFSEDLKRNKLCDKCSGKKKEHQGYDPTKRAFKKQEKGA